MTNIWTFFIKNYRLAYVIIVGIILFGGYTVFQIPKESSPEIDIPIAVVITALPGATAGDVEELVTNVIEKEVQNLDDVDSYTSVSSQGSSQITVNFDVDSDAKDKISGLKTAVDSAVSDLPSDALDPIVRQISLTDRPILSMALAGPYSLGELKGYAEALEDELEKITHVSEVNVVGAPEEEIRVTLNTSALAQYGLSAEQVSNGIARANLDIPIGSIETAGEVFSVRFAGRLVDAADVRNVSITAKDGIPVRVSDIATVEKVFTKSDTVTRFGLQGAEPQPSVVVDVFKKSGEGDIVTISGQVQETIDAYINSGLPDDVEIVITQNDADLIREDLTTLLTSGALTIVIILLVLMLFLGVREAFLASVVVPITFFTAFIVLSYIGFSINFLTLFSLILALGILVDASIVVVESMFEKIKAGSDPTKAATETIKEFQKPLIAGTLTTIFVFLPMMLMSGIIGKFIESIPVTVIVVLVAALISALGFITMLGTRFLKVRAADEKPHRIALVKKGIDIIFTWYGSVLKSLLQNSKKGTSFLVGIALLFVVIISLPVVGVVAVEMFPVTDQTEFTIDLTNPIGTPLSVTNAMAEEVEAVLQTDYRVEQFVTRVGSGSAAGSFGSSGGGGGNSHQGSFAISIADDVAVGSLALIAEYEDTIPQLVAAEVTIDQLAAGPSTGLPVQAKLSSENLGDLEEASSIIASALADIDGTRSIDDGVEEGNGEFVIEVDRAKTRSYGVTEIQVAQALRAAVSGSEATTLQQNGVDTKVMLNTIAGTESELGTLKQLSITELEGVTVTSPRGDIPVSLLTKTVLAPSRSSITHDDGERVVTVGAAIEPDANVQSIVAELQAKIPELNLPESVEVSFGGDAEDITESFTSLGTAMILGIIMILGLLIWQFNSYRQPFIVLVTIPLSLIGVFMGLIITGQPLSFPGFIGVVALAGIVVNNAIILLDSINNSRAEGLEITEAVEESANSRLQPILLTTITTVAGLTPLAFSDPAWAPLAVTIIFGLLFATVLTLVVVPLLYQRFAEKVLE